MKFLVCLFLSFFCVFTQARGIFASILEDDSSNIKASLEAAGMDPEVYMKIDPDVLLQKALEKEGDPRAGMDIGALLPAAEQGDAHAQFELAITYLAKHITLNNNKKVSKELKQSLYWYKRAAEQGSARAQIALGSIYCCSNSSTFEAEKGFFFKSPLVKKDWVKAFRLFKKAQDQLN